MRRREGSTPAQLLRLVFRTFGVSFALLRFNEHHDVGGAALKDLVRSSGEGARVCEVNSSQPSFGRRALSDVTGGRVQ